MIKNRRQCHILQEWHLPLSVFNTLFHICHNFLQKFMHSMYSGFCSLPKAFPEDIQVNERNGEGIHGFKIREMAECSYFALAILTL